jgi:hypothetical protein
MEQHEMEKSHSLSERSLNVSHIEQNMESPRKKQEENMEISKLKHQIEKLQIEYSKVYEEKVNNSFKIY